MGVKGGLGPRNVGYTRAYTTKEHVDIKFNSKLFTAQNYRLQTTTNDNSQMVFYSYM